MNYINPTIKILFITLAIYVFIMFQNIINSESNIVQNMINNNSIIIDDAKDVNDFKCVKDVLFINGCYANLLPHPYRYRVLHQIEQLKVGFLESDEIFYLDFNPIIVRYYRVLLSMDI